jgi:hypothetical protein
MSTAMPPSHAGSSGTFKMARWLTALIVAAGAILLIAGVTTWFVVRNQLADEDITVAEDAKWFAGEPVDGPLTAYSQAQTIEKHALAASNGMTYAELDREDPRRETVMNGSLLRASLFTSVVSFGVAAMAAGLGIVVMMIGLTLMQLTRRLAGMPATVTESSMAGAPGMQMGRPTTGGQPGTAGPQPAM